MKLHPSTPWAYKRGLQRHLKALKQRARKARWPQTSESGDLQVVVSSERHRRNFTWLWHYLSRRRCKCGETDMRVLDLHHRDPATKRFTIGASLWNVGLASLKVEAAKCDVICRNCHARHHSGRLKSAVSYGLLSDAQAAQYELVNRV